MDEILNIFPAANHEKKEVAGDDLVIDLKDNLMMATWILKELEEIDKILERH